MSDSTRPAAPYLPQEITSRILHYIPLKLERRTEVVSEYQSISALARISGSFGVEAQKKLVSSIYIISLAQLKKLVDSFPLGLLQRSQSLRLHRIPFTLEYSSLLFSVLQSTKNLNHLQIDNLPAAFIFNAIQTQLIGSTVMLPHLKSLQIYLRDATILDLLFSTAPNIEKLTVTTQESYAPYLGAPFTSHLNGLRELSLEGKCGTEIVEQKMWPAIEFKDLNLLQVGSVEVEDDAVFLFFETIGSSLLEAKFQSLGYYPFQLFRFMSVLERLEIFSLNHEQQIIDLPSTITRLKIRIVTIPRNLSWLRLRKLKVLEITSLKSPIDFSNLPPLSFVRIRSASIETILECLKNLEVGMVFPSLELGTTSDSIDPLLDESEIKERCEELGIELVKCN